jgi:beta-glucosidase-like glycosyl hydrolase/CubicO group peptidase (beta-lactamase class C family)
MMHRKVWPLVFFVILYSANRSIASSCAQLEFSHENDSNAQDTLRPPFLKADHLRWADSVLHSLNQREQIAQLLMPPVYAHENHKDWEVAEQWAQKGLIGGVICMQGHPQGQIQRIKGLQRNSKVPLLISSDAEWGLGMRLDSTRSWPRALTIGAANDTALTRKFGQEVGNALLGTGVQVNFAPVVDVNSNPLNPVIGSRSFGSSVQRVAEMGIAYAQGMQDVGVLATAKHFPGHGDTDSDSHKTLPSILHDRSRLDSIELEPFRQIVNEGITAMMAAHLSIPSLDATPGRPSTLSPLVIDSILRQELKFDGLIFTDAMTMKGFSEFALTETPHVDALIAGNDILLFPGDPVEAINEIEAAIASNRIDSLLIAEKCRRLLAAKSWGMAMAPIAGPYDSDRAEAIHRELLAKSLTVVTNRDRLLPWGDAVNDVESLFIGWPGQPHQQFNAVAQRIMGGTSAFSGQSMTDRMFLEQAKSIIPGSLAKEPDWLVIHLGGTSHSVSKQHGIPNEVIHQLEWTLALANERNIPTTLVVYGSPYLLERLAKCAALTHALVIAYQDDDRTIDAVADALTGAGMAGGSLPVSVGTFPEGHGLPWLGRQRLGFSKVPFDAKMKIDSIALDAIAGGAMPGCRVVVAHKGMIVHDGVYGTLDGSAPVKPSTVYDLASITKIAASTLSLMHLEEKGLLDRNDRLDALLPELKGTEMGSRFLQDVLAHRAGLTSWIPFYLEALEDSTAFSNIPTAAHAQKITDACFMRPSWKDSIWHKITTAPVDPVGKHRYSDLGFYAIQRIIESKTGKSLDQFTQEMFYGKAGWNSLGFEPLEKINPGNIAPTENDTIFRKGIVRGTVHDPGAAMLEGVCGHAGLFGNAYDLSRLMHMLRMGGSYGKTEWFQAETILDWTSRVDADPEYRKASGFDRPANEPDSGPTCNEASSSSFGHSGFTGTLAWADPDADIVFVFLSNRTFPDAGNRKLIDWDIRTKMQHEVYLSLGVASRFDEPSQE